MQQIPHAMFNLNVVYMMYDPEHWCEVPGFDDPNDTTVYKWGLQDVQNISFVFPSENERGMYVRDSVKTIVTDWNLVCDDYLMKGHAHLFYSFGYLVGCVLGGVASDNFGRKPTVIGFGILSSMFGVFLPYTTYYPMFLFIRFCTADLAAYTLCMEITGIRFFHIYDISRCILYYWFSFCFKTIFSTPPFPFNLCRINRGSLPSDLELVCHREKRLNKKVIHKKR
uniref:MFS domain-containing protein n=1 Tax=Heterorhabditis bacteriophora TaxID=37862 RepID=A0A1I7X3B5_HETBA